MEPACGEGDIVVTTHVRCMCVVLACIVCVASGFVPAITCTFMHRSEKNLAQLFSLRSRSAI